MHFRRARSRHRRFLSPIHFYRRQEDVNYLGSVLFWGLILSRGSRVAGEHPGSSRSAWRRRIGSAVALAGAMTLVLVASPGKSRADYSSIVIDAESGAVLEEQNADAANYPASLTKMMTLYLVFDALEHGRLGLKQPVAVSSHAAMQAPSRLGLRAGQTITVEQAILAL